jgi:hypothetical protein
MNIRRNLPSRTNLRRLRSAASGLSACVYLITSTGCYTSPENVDSFGLGGYSTELREFQLEAGAPVGIKYRSYFPVRYKFLHPESGTQLDAGVSADYDQVFTPRFGGTYVFRFQPVNRQPALVQLHPPTPVSEQANEDRR